MFTILLLAFSFYYTDKSIDLVRESDPIMKKIRENSHKYSVKSVNAKIDGNKIIPGVVGIDVDYDKSYKKMKNYGTYNESLTVFKETKPVVSVSDYYDKYISGGNGVSNSVALVFKVNKNSDPSNIINILKENNVSATFFIDGIWLENNLSSFNSFSDFEVELLNYDDRYEEIYFSSSLNTLSSLTKTNPKYCYAEYDNKEVLELCGRVGLHTIIPTIKVGNYPYMEIKKKLRAADIISLPINTTTEIELKTVIDYIKQKGYELVLLDDLLSENASK